MKIVLLISIALIFNNTELKKIQLINDSTIEYVGSKLDSLICHDTTLPRIEEIKGIEYLELYNAEFGNLPKSIVGLKSLKKISIATNIRMTKLPLEIGQLISLEEIELIKVFKIKSLPNEICNLTNLKKLTVAWGGQLSAIPDNIGDLANLHTLDLGRNKISQLPESIKKLKNLKTLVLWENPIDKNELEKIKSWLPNTKVYFDHPLGH